MMITITISTITKTLKVEYSVLYVGVANCVVTGLVPLTLLAFLNLVI